MRHIVKPDHTVETIGDNGIGMTVTTWRTHGAALAYAELMASRVGGEVVDETQPWTSARWLQEASEIERLRDLLDELSTLCLRMADLSIGDDSREAEALRRRVADFGDLMPKKAS